MEKMNKLKKEKKICLDEAMVKKPKLKHGSSSQLLFKDFPKLFSECVMFIRDRRNTNLKVHWCTFENLPVCSCAYKNNSLKISHSIYKEFSSYIPVKFAKCLFTNIQTQYNMLKISLLFKKNTNFTGE